MEITPLCRALALHEIFDASGVAAGGSLRRSELEQAWQGVGLRAADLAEALAEARSTGEFSTQGSGPDCRVVLTDLGVDESQRDLSSLRQIEALVRAYALLRVLRHRRPAGPMFGRRRSDHADC